MRLSGLVIGGFHDLRIYICGLVLLHSFLRLPKFMFKPTSWQTASNSVIIVLISPVVCERRAFRRIQIPLISNCLKVWSRAAVKSLGDNVSPCLILLLTFIHFVSLCNPTVMVALPFMSLIILEYRQFISMVSNALRKSTKVVNCRSTKGILSEYIDSQWQSQKM